MLKVIERNNAKCKEAQDTQISMVSKWAVKTIQLQTRLLSMEKEGGSGRRN